MCQCGDGVRAAVHAKVMELASRGIRALAVARADTCDPKPPFAVHPPSASSTSNGAGVGAGDGGWEFLGILTFKDPPRPDTKRTIERAVENGIAVKMITGDQVTAL